MTTTGSPASEDDFRRLVEPHRRELHAHCYRMLGSVHDADDALQDALVRAWRSLPRFEGRSSLRSWLYRIATNTCIDAAQARTRRGLPMDFGPASDPHDGIGAPVAETVWVEPYPDVEQGYEQREGVELAFIAALQHLPARQRAVLVMREVLGFSAIETGEALDMTVASVNSAMQRARKAVDERMPEAGQQETLRALGDARTKEIVGAYVDAWERGDVEGVVAMLAEDATLAMPPMPIWYRGRDDVRVFLETAFSHTWDLKTFVEGERTVRLLQTQANGQPAVAAYRWDGERFHPYALQVLSLRTDGAIADITGFVNPGDVPRFGLPASFAR
jgi:RNA polymerase sigma-70 factor (ECF subfamily)